jgi:V8-like Glu-specific endopeptidase
MRLARLIAALALIAAPVAAETPLRSLQTADDSRGFEGVGKLMLGERGFCTGALIAPDRVLTAAHCLFDRETGARIEPRLIEFRAGWRNGRAEAYRGILRAVAHPEYVYGGHDKLDRVGFDVALLVLDQPIRLPGLLPFATGLRPRIGEEVGVVSYAQHRAEAPSIQEVCDVMVSETDLLVLSCSVDYGSSGSPVFTLGPEGPQVISVISAKAELDGRKVSLAVPLDHPLGVLEMELARALAAERPAVAGVRVLSGGQGGAQGGAKFLRPGAAEGAP